MEVGEGGRTEVVVVLGVEPDGDLVADDGRDPGLAQHRRRVDGGGAQQGEGGGGLVVDVPLEQGPDPGADLGGGPLAGGAGGRPDRVGQGRPRPLPVPFGHEPLDPAAQVDLDPGGQGGGVGGQGGGVGRVVGGHPARMAPVDRPTPIAPGPGQESVWDYPRPPRVEPADAHVVVVHGGVVVADTRRALRVLETSQAPALYLPGDDVAPGALRAATTRSFCEWKGTASYADVVAGGAVAPSAAWTYLHPVPAYEVLVDHWAFFPQRLDRCTIDGEVVRPMDGGVYGGWVTDAVVGPIKGGPGTAHW